VRPVFLARYKGIFSSLINRRPMNVPPYRRRCTTTKYLERAHTCRRRVHRVAAGYIDGWESEPLKRLSQSGCTSDHKHNARGRRGFELHVAQQGLFPRPQLQVPCIDIFACPKAKMVLATSKRPRCSSDWSTIRSSITTFASHITATIYFNCKRVPKVVTICRVASTRAYRRF
jgi:hypothetical protein